MMDEDIPELLLAGFVPLRAQGLALPCYASGPLSNAWYCAVCSIDGDHTGTVIGFEPFESDDIIRLPAAAARTVSIGDPWHDVLLWKEEFYVGTPAIIIAQLGETAAELAAEAPLTLLDLAMAGEGLDRAALAATAYAHVRAQWGEAEADRWQSDGFARQQLMLEARRLLAAAGAEGAGVVRGIEVERTGSGLMADIPAALVQLLQEHGIFPRFAARVATLAQETHLPLAPVPEPGGPAAERDPVSDDAADAAEPLADEAPGPSSSADARAANVLVLASGARARLLLRHIQRPDWQPHWEDAPRPRRGRQSSGRLDPDFARVDVVDDLNGLPDLSPYEVIIWLVDDEAFLNDQGRVTGAQLQAALGHGAMPLCIIAPMLPAQQPPAILADRSAASDLPLFDTILDTAVVRSPFWPGNSRRSIDRRVADLVSATALLAAPRSPLHAWLTEDRPRYEPLLLSIASGIRQSRDSSGLFSEVSSAGVFAEGRRRREVEEFTWSEIPRGGERSKELQGMAVVRRHQPDFQPFAEAVTKHMPSSRPLQRDSKLLGEVPDPIANALIYPYLAAAFRAESKRGDRICVVAAEAPGLKALRAAAKIGWSVIRYSDEESLRSLASDRRRRTADLPADIAMPDLNRLGRNRGLAIRGVDPRDVVRMPIHVLEDWRKRFSGSDLVASFRWYRSIINRYDDPPEAAGVAAVPAELFFQGEMQNEPAATFLRDHADVVAAGVRAKRTADLRASWSEPAKGAARFMFEDGKLPVHFGPVDHHEVAAQKFFTIDGDASVPLLFSSRLFRVWARATLTRSPSWSSRFSITRTYETFPLPDQFMVLNDGEGDRASLRASPRSKSLSALLKNYDPDMLRMEYSQVGRTSDLASDRRDYFSEVEASLLDMIGLPPDVSDLDLLERLVDMNRNAGADDYRAGEGFSDRWLSDRPRADTETWDVVVEGPNDEIGLRGIIERLSSHRTDQIRIWSAGGSSSIPSMLRNLRDAGHENLAVLLDREDASQRLIDEVRMLIDDRGGYLVLISPNMEDWLEACCPTDYALAMPATGVRAKAMRRFSGHANLDEVLTSNEEFAKWVGDALGVTLEKLPPS
ncbi:hypothetical protein [Mangrovibrevibacter kandeliae]|uniref:hypothetical protein n=1 Tax=Mangrovibrevibacter kandeliae TaxID=2968473 RepID=UPI002117AA6D|nr:hypothetical protein [Aurantimonas sp. CSK15Z-1]MCQ8782155.1 hypothetical protein [Aurantimonas sp. CSK15Z-1]